MVHEVKYKGQIIDPKDIEVTWSDHFGEIMHGSIEDYGNSEYMMLGKNVRLIAECAQQLVRLRDNLWGKDHELDKAEPLDVPTMTTDFVKEHGLPCPEGHIFKDENGNVINAMKIVLEKKKREYPTFKNLGECKEILGEKDMYQGVSGYKGTLLTSFQRLLIFRDAYWKIAGEEMGLGKPWEPPYGGEPIDTFCLQVYQNRITKVKDNSANHCILSFPTAEMRDAFYENFKELIEMCKELL